MTEDVRLSLSAGAEIKYVKQPCLWGSAVKTMTCNNSRHAQGTPRQTAYTRIRFPSGSKNGVSTTVALSLPEEVTMVNLEPIFASFTGT